MTPDKKVSPAIRILRGERDASARATHLKAATRKFLVTTNERKQMSTKTNFKRIALVAVAALGLGVLSSVPAKAVFSSVPTITVANGTATYGAADSSTAATAGIVWSTTAGSETLVVTVSQIAGPQAVTGRMTFVDTAGAFTTTSAAYNNSTVPYTNSTQHALIGSTTMTATSGNGYNALNLLVQMDSTTVRTNYSGTYTYRVTATAKSATSFENDKIATADVSIVIAKPSAEATTASAGTSTAYISTTAANSSATTDAIPNVLATASTTARAYIYVNLKNAAGAAAAESLTVTTSVGTVGTSSASVGKSIVLAYNGAMDVGVYSDGNAGTATITIKSASVTFANKTVVFYAAAPSTLVASAINTSPGVGSTTAIAVDAKDASGNRWAGTLYTYSSDAAVFSQTGTTATSSSCSYVAARDRHECSVTGVAAGTATITVRDATTAALATKSSNAVSLTVTDASPAKVVLAWDKATYAPGEKATLVVSVVGSDGKSVSARTFSNLFATGGISLSTAAGNGSDTTTAVAVTTTSLAALALSTNTSPVAAYTIYMPASGGTVKASATGGTSLPLAGQVAVSATATVTDSGAAALAAVNALATTVASLKTLITTLTNLVLKIQKKVKA